jgi:NodT family efflux transporter outer membrane factor (OMF) lipoprotein
MGSPSKVPRCLDLTLCCALAAALLAASGCKVGPDYEEPVTPMEDEWSAAVEAEMTAETPDIERWWEELGDTVLTDLIRQSEMTNLDLRVSVSRVAEARALRGIAKGDLYPNLVLEGSYSYTQLSDNSPGGQIIEAVGGENDPIDQWGTSAASAWEIDVFGRIRRNIEAADAQLQAGVEDYRDVLVSLYAEVALNYVDVRSLQLRLDFARSNADAQGESLGLTQDRFNAGLTSALDVAQAEQNLAQTESLIPSLETRLNAALNRLAVLLGEQPGSLEARLGPDAPIPSTPADITSGVPADLLRRRPDIRRAERVLASQTALIGVAKADLYPTFSLTGFIEGIASTFTGQFDSGSGGWGIVPGFRWDLFQGGKIRNNIRAQEARTDQALYGYQQTVLLALEEVENSLVAYDRERQRRDRLQEAVDASQQAVDLVRTQYLAGLTNFQNLLDSQRSLFQQQDQLAESEGLVVQSLVVLNRSLGGGWAPAELDPDQQNTPDLDGTDTQDNGASGPAQPQGGDDQESR